MPKNSQRKLEVNLFRRWLDLAVSIVVGLIYFVSNPKPQSYYDYTFRVAANMLRGRIGFAEKQPTWLNEFAPFEGFYYSVFPLGAVVSMVPFALLSKLGFISEMPGAWISALLAGCACWFMLKIASKYDIDQVKQILLSLAVLFGTFMWTNLVFAGAWQLALGFAMVGELGAIYFTVYDRRAFVAGLFFALAFGNRTEILLTAPLLIYLLVRNEPDADLNTEKRPLMPKINRETLLRTALFCSVPFVLGVATLIYNYVRFHSISDFGYARIPGVLQEPWYRYGIFSIWYIPGQAWEMLFKIWYTKPTFPYLFPDGFSNSILLSSPFLIFVLRFGYRDRALKYSAWAAVVVLTFLLWIHGNSGGWQFAYRYAMVLLPWIFVILLENSRRRVSVVEWPLLSLSFLANIYATWIFHWTRYLN